MNILFLLFVFLFGLLIGSFLNVLIIRLPKNEDVIYKRSHCCSCQELIPWYLNIPLVSFFYLRGKCAHCGIAISKQYIFVEALTGFLAVIVFLLKAGTSTLEIYQFFFYFSVCCVFLTHTIVDLKHKILPNMLTIYLALLFLMDRLLYGSWSFALIGGAIGFLFPLGITYLFFKIKGVVGLGGGDIKLYGALGIYLGPYSVIHNIFLSCLAGSIFSLVMMAFGKMDKKTPIPFGPFILLIGVIQIFLPGFLEKLISLV